MSYHGNQDENSSFGFAFNRKKVKYSVLDELFAERVIETSVTLFIDMKYIMDIMRIKYYADMVTSEFVTDSNKVIAETLNFIVHYKRYFVEKRNCNLQVVLMFDSGKTPDKYKTAITPDWSKTIIEKTVKPAYLGFIGEKMARFANCIPDLFVVNTDDVDLSVIPALSQRQDPNVLTQSKYNVFISNDPLIQQYSQCFKGFFNLHPAGENSKMVTTNGYFNYLYEKHKYAVKHGDELKTSDSFIQLYGNLVGTDDVPMIAKYKSKKAIDLINKIKQTHSKFNDYDILKDFDVLDADIETMKARVALFDVFEHVNLLADEDILKVESQFAAANKVSRSDFDHYNITAFDNRVEVSTLFM
jgi:hypothetical protein